MGNGHPSIAPYDLYGAADGELVVAVGTNRQFAALCAELGAADLPADERFRTNSARVMHRDALRRELEQRLASESAREWAARLNRAGVPAGEVNDIAGAFAFARQLGLEPVVEVPRADGSVARLTRNPIKLSVTPAEYWAPPPELPHREARS
jgi:crotonobetainyl-CoA:carnitine CoA-transferase CaiB-like acyl-CoA transferase